jgi:membrane-bound serine protease (ClpP class)
MILSLFVAAVCWANSIYFVEITGSINPGSASYFMEAVNKAQSGRALVLQLNTPGGLLSSTRDMIQAISQSKVPVVVYVAPGGASATSAGALIALSSHVAAMAPGSNIGAAHPVASGGQDVKGDMGEKVTNDTAALARAQAELRGRPKDEAEKIVTKSQSYSSEEAVKKKVVEIQAGSLEELLTALSKTTNPITGKDSVAPLGFTAKDLENIPMNLKQKVLHFIADPNISAMLIALGGLALYAEVSSGFATLIPGAIGVFCLLLGFISMQTIPINLGGVLLFLLGFFFLVAEAFITSYGLLTLASVVSLFLGGLFFIDPSAASMRVSLSLLIPLVGGIGIVVATIAYILAKDARAKKTNWNSAEGKSAVVNKLNADARSGYIILDGELWEFSSDTPLNVGDEVVVEKMESLKAKVQRRK